ncbi:MAG TPA: hypothetical protein VGH89_38105, partial [Pseudonocardia sp.]
MTSVSAGAARREDRSGLDEGQFGERLRAFLAAEHPGRAPRGERAKLAFQRAWQATLVYADWIAPG